MLNAINDGRKYQLPKLSLTLNNHNPNASISYDLSPKGGHITAGIGNNHPFIHGQASSWLDTSMFDIAWKSAQYDRSFYGGGILYWILGGDQMWEICHRFSQPKWFLDGEMRFYSQLWMGSSYDMPRQRSRLVAHLQANPAQTYEQVYLGSYQQFVPENEQLGQLMVAYGIKEYSNNLWNYTVNYAVSNWYSVHTFESSLLRYGPTTLKTLYKGSTEKLIKTWDRQRKNRYENKSIALLPPTKSALHHHNPIRNSDGDLLYLQKGMQDTGSIWLQPTDQLHPQKIITLGKMTDVHFDEHEGYIIWTEQKKDLIWRNRIHQDLYILNIESMKKHRLTKGEIIYSPVFSPDGLNIAFMKMEDNGQIVLHIRSNTGEPLQQKELAIGDHFDLSWEDELCWVHKSIDEGNRIVCTGDQKLSPQTEYDWTWISLSAPIKQHNKLLFVSSQTTGEEIRMWDHTQEYRIAASDYGAVEPWFGDDEIIYSEYHDRGQRLVSVPRIDKIWKPVAPIQEKHPTPPTYKPYPTESYPRWNGLFQLHSWNPSYSATDGIYQLGIHSNNLRETLSFSANGSWDSINSISLYSGELTYKEFWPQITLYTTAGQQYREITPQIFGLSSASSITFDTTIYGSSITLPLYLQEGPFQGITNFHLGWQFIENNNINTKNFTLPVEDIGLVTEAQQQIVFQVESSMRQDQAPMHIAPLLGYDAYLEFQQIIGGDFGIFAQAQIWLPSVFPNHSIQLNGGYSDLSFHHEASELLPIGTTAKMFDSLSYLQLRYSAPIAYPNFGFDGWIYIKRIRSSLFVEHSLRDDQTIDAAGIGFDLDIHLLRSPQALPQLGLDIAYHQNNQIVIMPKLKMYSF